MRPAANSDGTPQPRNLAYTDEHIAGGSMRLVVIFITATILLADEKGWYPHEGGLLKYRVNIRFGEEPDTMPAGWKFGRVSAVAVNSKREVLVFHRGPKADPIVIFD